MNVHETGWVCDYHVGAGNAYRNLVGINEGKALLYLSQDVVKRLAAVSSQHSLSQDVVK